MQPVLDALEQHLGPRLGGGSVVLALSGGLDSMVLLHGLAAYRERHPALRLKAVHVHHGLSANADAWATHCEGQCRLLGVDFVLERLSLEKGPRQSLEALAREGRYALLAKHVGQGDCLVTAHHLDDQAETLLLAAKRGAGFEGLCAMPIARPFGAGLLVRPLLGLSRAELETQAQGLSWVEDESNQDQGFDRNFLRQSLLPLAQSRLPGFARGLARSAELLAEERPARDWLLSQELKRRRHADGSLDITGVPDEAAALLLKAWAAENGRALSHKQLRELLAQQQARADAQAQVGGFGRFQGRWYPLPAETQASAELAWLPGGGLPAGIPWQLAFDLPGATPFHPQDRDKGRTLKKLWQEWGVPPWLRSRWPLLVSKDGQLLAVPGLAVAKEHYEQGGLFPVPNDPALMPFMKKRP
ncbi:tRNA lysidine(34) synthetase TilS [Gallaecimonas kandeliae]|uniref:tRNA lysidine(34) synthetase TilS n=1 Tax=Gallaecimonas kandeliae TaxID=3029055 RepID=UPI0026494FC7|nr:tRNA lysidine(34) synthetase TilS [Gallaecimonas kandeliae]WKE64511.1 tRNA lysidine(34) synthetase TilS [Gallaecimonas kandeliae]